MPDKVIPETIFEHCCDTPMCPQVLPGCLLELDTMYQQSWHERDSLNSNLLMASYYFRLGPVHVPHHRIDL